MNRSTLIPDAAYERADRVAEVFGLSRYHARYELQKIADGRFDTSHNLGIALNELSLRVSGLSPMQYFMDRTRSIEEPAMAPEDTVIGR